MEILLALGKSDGTVAVVLLTDERCAAENKALFGVDMSVH
jgi:hypothetical protein